MRIEYTVQIWREGDQYVAHAMPIDVASAGESPEQARQAVDEAVGLFLSVAREQGTLNDILRGVLLRVSRRLLAPPGVCRLFGDGLLNPQFRKRIESPVKWGEDRSLTRAAQ